jgi:acyl-CoA synthetase (AMP-forming)/AMP-acid ligase II/acyl carrier protein
MAPGLKVTQVNVSDDGSPRRPVNGDALWRQFPVIVDQHGLKCTHLDEFDGLGTYGNLETIRNLLENRGTCFTITPICFRSGGISFSIEKTLLEESSLLMADLQLVTPDFRSSDFPSTLFGLARYRARHQPEMVGYTYLVDGETQEENLTYGQLDRQARAIAARMQALCRAGDHVLLLYEPGLDYVAAFFGCQYAGVIPVPAYPPDPLRSERTLSRLQAIVTDCGASLALTTKEVAGASGSGLANRLGLRLLLPTDEWMEWVDLPWRAPEPRAEDVALLQYTSGSTAVPRGVLVTHRNFWYQVQCMEVGDLPNAVGVTWLPLYHDLGLVGGMLTPLYFARRVIQLSPLAFVQNPLRWLLAVSRYRATTTGTPNFALDLCVSKFDPTTLGDECLDLSSLRIILTGAETVRADTLERFTATFAPYGLAEDVWLPSYGLAEATLGVTGGPNTAKPLCVAFSARELEFHRAVPVERGDVSGRRLVGCGRPLERSEVLIVEPERQAELPAGQVGEVWVQGPGVARGYWNRPEETQAVFQAHVTGHANRGPYLRTGDLGFFHQGQLFLTGRLKEVMVFWGRNVYPQDVEQTASACDPGLRENGCAAFAIEIDGREQLAVVQEMARPAKFDAEAVAQAIQRAIQAVHQVPLHALVLLKSGTLPKTSSGKIQRNLCREKLLSGDLKVLREWRFPVDIVGRATPTNGDRALPGRDEIKSWLVQRVARHCNVAEDAIDADAPLNAYVLDSVSAVTIALELQEWVGRSVSPTVLYDSPSVASLAERLADPRSYLAGAPVLPADVDRLTPGELDQALAQFLGEPPSLLPPSLTRGPDRSAFPTHD